MKFLGSFFLKIIFLYYIFSFSFLCQVEDFYDFIYLLLKYFPMYILINIFPFSSLPRSSMPLHLSNFTSSFPLFLQNRQIKRQRNKNKTKQTINRKKKRHKKHIHVDVRAHVHTHTQKKISKVYMPKQTSLRQNVS